jgi:hypothetical protein
MNGVEEEALGLAQEAKLYRRTELERSRSIQGGITAEFRLYRA